MRIRDPESFLPWIRDRKNADPGTAFRIRNTEKSKADPEITHGTLLFSFAQGIF
jgi:hypothetical protein